MATATTRFAFGSILFAGILVAFAPQVNAAPSLRGMRQRVRSSSQHGKLHRAKQWVKANPGKAVAGAFIVGALATNPGFTIPAAFFAGKVVAGAVGTAATYAVAHATPLLVGGAAGYLGAKMAMRKGKEPGARGPGLLSRVRGRIDKARSGGGLGALWGKGNKNKTASEPAPADGQHQVIHLPPPSATPTNTSVPHSSSSAAH